MLKQANLAAPIGDRLSVRSVPHPFPQAVGTAHDPIFGRAELAAITLPYDRNAEIFGEDEPAVYLYRVVSGAVRTYRLLSDGRRQICGFHMAGEIFGLEAGETHSCSAEAIGSTVVQAVRRAPVIALAARDGDVARYLWAVTAQELQRAQTHALLLVKSAQERVAAFLLQMRPNNGSNTIELPMSRQDIADYLGLTIETVSRTFTQLEGDAKIELPATRRIVLRDRRGLQELNS
ncbi:MAG TPA: helix-turn-helix domain-containing protein [Xanthobacteraceae bacterium]|nr:helix-turn-helix domain-containing protein [Xanthobacteraceae bacterium]